MSKDDSRRMTTEQRQEMERQDAIRSLAKMGMQTTGDGDAYSEERYSADELHRRRAAINEALSAESYARQPEEVDYSLIAVFFRSLPLIFVSVIILFFVMVWIYTV